MTLALLASPICTANPGGLFLLTLHKADFQDQGRSQHYAGPAEDVRRSRPHSINGCAHHMAQPSKKVRRGITRLLALPAAPAR